MNIIIDTREQKPLKFTGHETTRRKLDEGDYAVEYMVGFYDSNNLLARKLCSTEHQIVIERKSVEDFYGSIIQGHQRFKREILRAQEKGKTFYIFLEGYLLDVYMYCYQRNMKPETMEKIVTTMKSRYNLQIVECKTRKEMAKKIVQLCTEMEKW